MALQASRFRLDTFEPSYEWRAVPQDVCIPPGLEVKLRLQSEGARIARIPPNWRLLVVSAPGNDACRIDVARMTRLAEVRNLILRELGLSVDEKVVAVLRADSADVAGGLAGDHGWTQTVEEARLFGRRATCVIRPAVRAQGKATQESGLRQRALELVKQETKSMAYCRGHPSDLGLPTRQEIHDLFVATSADQHNMFLHKPPASSLDERESKRTKVSLDGATFVHQRTRRPFAPPYRLRHKTKDVWSLTRCKTDSQTVLQTKPACVNHLRPRRKSWLPRKLAEIAKLSVAEPVILPSPQQELLLPIRRRRTSFLQRKVADISRSTYDQSFVPLLRGKSTKFRRRRSSWLPRKVAELIGQSACKTAS